MKLLFALEFFKWIGQRCSTSCVHDSSIVLGMPWSFDHFWRILVVVFRKVVLEGKNCDCPDDEAMAMRSGGSDISDIGLAM